MRIKGTLATYQFVSKIYFSDMINKIYKIKQFFIWYLIVKILLILSN
jgi:hypothetical protein